MELYFKLQIFARKISPFFAFLLFATENADVKRFALLIINNTCMRPERACRIKTHFLWRIPIDIHATRSSTIIIMVLSGMSNMEQLDKDLKTYAEDKPLNDKEMSAFMAMPDDKKPSACLHCHSCEHVCPQNIKISDMMADFVKKIG